MPYIRGFWENYQKTLILCALFFPRNFVSKYITGKILHNFIMYIITLNYGRIMANLKKYFVFCHNLATFLLYSITISIFANTCAFKHCE